LRRARGRRAPRRPRPLPPPHHHPSVLRPGARPPHRHTHARRRGRGELEQQGGEAAVLRPAGVVGETGRRASAARSIC
jgi:hypothetical protein